MLLPLRTNCMDCSCILQRRKRKSPIKHYSTYCSWILWQEWHPEMQRCHLCCPPKWDRSRPWKSHIDMDHRRTMCRREVRRRRWLEKISWWRWIRAEGKWRESTMRSDENLFVNTGYQLVSIVCSNTASRCFSMQNCVMLLSSMSTFTPCWIELSALRTIGRDRNESLARLFSCYRFVRNRRCAWRKAKYRPSTTNWFRRTRLFHLSQ